MHQAHLQTLVGISGQGPSHLLRGVAFMALIITHPGIKEIAQYPEMTGQVLLDGAIDPVQAETGEAWGLVCKMQIRDHQNAILFAE